MACANHLNVQVFALALIILSGYASAFQIQTSGLALRSRQDGVGARPICSLPAPLRTRSMHTAASLCMNEAATEETKSGDQWFTLAVSAQGEGKGEDALKILDKAEAAWKSEGKLDGDTPYAKVLSEMREKLQSAGQKEENQEQIALLKSVNDEAAKATAALEKREVSTARVAFDEATKLYESDAELDDKDTSLKLRELGQNVKFAEWKLQAEKNTARSEEEWVEREKMKKARKDDVKAEVEKLQTGDSAMAMRTQAKERADTAFSLAEELLAEGDFAGAREQLALAEEGWGQAGMLNFPGKPFELAIEGVLEKIAEQEAA